MCRLFAQFSPEPRGAREFLVDSQFSLLKQSNANAQNVQKDGWGIGWIDAQKGTVVVKSPRAAFNEAKRFKAAADRGVSTAVLGHLRAASNPLGISRARLLTTASAQPYSDGEWLFIHNGTLEIPREIAAELGPLRERIKSKNDSEVYFWQFHKFLKRTGDAALAFEACIRETWAVWRANPDKHYGKETPYTSLNAIATNGRELYAFCHGVRMGMVTCGVCNPSQPWQVMSFSQRDDGLLVASENLDAGRWTRFSTPEILKAGLSGGRVRVERIPYVLEKGVLVRKTVALT